MAPTNINYQLLTNISNLYAFELLVFIVQIFLSIIITTKQLVCRLVFGITFYIN